MKTCLLFVALLSVAFALSAEDAEEVAKLQKDFTLEDCDKDVVVPSEDVCLAAYPVYHWNNEKKECENVIFGGCHRTRNNFRTKEICEGVAKRICIGPL